MLIGSPKIDSATIALANEKELEIKVYNLAEENIYVEKALFNGKNINGFKISVRQIMQGGRLEIYMKH